MIDLARRRPLVILAKAIWRNDERGGQQESSGLKSERSRSSGAAVVRVASVKAK